MREWEDPGAVGVLALADPLSEILRALDVAYVRAAYLAVVDALAKVGIGTKELRFGWVHPGYCALGWKAPSTPLDWTGWTTPDLYRWPDRKQEQLWAHVESALLPRSPRLVGGSASMRARVTPIALDDAEAILAAVIDSALDEPTNWTVAALREAAEGDDPEEPWWRAVRAREDRDEASVDAALTDAARLYSPAGATILQTVFRGKDAPGATK